MRKTAVYGILLVSVSLATPAFASPYSANFATTQATSVNSQIQALEGSDNILIYDAFAVVQEVAAAPTPITVTVSGTALS
jgi:hypothetical protein